MKVISINIGEARTLTIANREVASGIYKSAVATPVKVSIEGLDQDAICDLDNHGGADQAVYIYSTVDYVWWEQELGHALQPGQFGENLTISDLNMEGICFGDQLQVGEVRLEFTSARIPCSKFAHRMGDTGWVKRFKDAARPGYYCRVLTVGTIQVGDEVRFYPVDGKRIPIIELFHLWYNRPAPRDDLERLLATPLASRARAALENWLTTAV